MVLQAQTTLKKTLALLEAQQKQTANQIKAVRAALTVLEQSSSPHLAARRRRKPMSSAERKSVSKRMKSYWAKQRATNKAR